MSVRNGQGTMPDKAGGHGSPRVRSGSSCTRSNGRRAERRSLRCRPPDIDCGRTVRGRSLVIDPQAFWGTDWDRNPRGRLPNLCTCVLWALVVGGAGLPSCGDPPRTCLERVITYTGSKPGTAYLRVASDDGGRSLFIGSNAAAASDYTPPRRGST